MRQCPLPTLIVLSRPDELLLPADQLLPLTSTMNACVAACANSGFCWADVAHKQTSSDSVRNAQEQSPHKQLHFQSLLVDRVVLLQHCLKSVMKHLKTFLRYGCQ